ncbi:MAG TPA: cbb3-type cytochrome c oxidase subunit II [Bryobacteraceae bacterium]|nr:cbb3-type cytochrome c oxidase subunit II [Bryobacteraceae bacterium]
MKRFLRMSYLAASIGGVGFFVMSVVLLAVWPGRVLERQIQSTSPDHPLPLSASEQRGRLIYSQNGCAYCHTQQIRYLDRDVKRFGAATLAWETIFDSPQLWGTRRIGPDLSREYGVHSDDWEFAHLYEPRSMMADSVMPPFPWLFDGGADHPRQAARDVVAYLNALGRNRALAGKEGEAHSRANCECSDEERHAAYDAPLLNASTSIPRREGDVPKLSPDGDLKRGLQLYARNCASCHGRKGAGDGRGAAALRPRPTNFTEHEYTLDRVSFALWNGVAGTSMPAWRDLTTQDLSDVAAVIRSFHAGGSGQAPANDAGRLIYEAQCAQCHGQDGAGDGPASTRFSVAATNFRTSRADLEASTRAVRDGVEGTPMAPWTSRLSDTELQNVAGYVRSFFQGARP